MSDHAFLKRSTRSHLFTFPLALFTFFSLLLAAHSALHAAEVRLAWDANTEPVAGYRLYYGHASRSYQTSVDVGKVTTYTWRLAHGMMIKYLTAPPEDFWG